MARLTPWLLLALAGCRAPVATAEEEYRGVVASLWLRAGKAAAEVSTGSSDYQLRLVRSQLLDLQDKLANPPRPRAVPRVTPDEETTTLQLTAVETMISRVEAALDVHDAQRRLEARVRLARGQSALPEARLRERLQGSDPLYRDAVNDLEEAKTNYEASAATLAELRQPLLDKGLPVSF